ncbi:MAG: DegT/DnrJ/EryC1/StrS family aminotransferase, partial [Candidatus Binatia bacterium]
ASIRGEIEKAVGDVFAEQGFVLGPRVERLEDEIRVYTGATCAVGVASGSDALLLALMALGVAPGDTIVTTSFSFFATASAPVRLGARVCFADLDPATFNLSATTIEAALARRRPTGRLVILPVHLYGRAAPMEEIVRLAKRLDAPIVEDAAQSIGAFADVGGARVMTGAIGDFGALSFFPSKNLGGAGDGGMILARTKELGDAVSMLRVHGSRRRYEHDSVGINSRLDALQAAVLSVKLRHLDAWNAARRERAAAYRERFRAAGLAPGPVVVPEDAGNGHVWHQFVIRAERRDALRAALLEAGVETQVYYPIPLHLQPCFLDQGCPAGELPECERAAREVLALPIHPELGDDALDHVVDVASRFYG